AIRFDGWSIDRSPCLYGRDLLQTVTTLSSGSLERRSRPFSARRPSPARLLSVFRHTGSPDDPFTVPVSHGSEVSGPGHKRPFAPAHGDGLGRPRAAPARDEPAQTARPGEPKRPPIRPARGRRGDPPNPKSLRNEADDIRARVGMAA